MGAVPPGDERLGRGRRIRSQAHPHGERGTGWQTATEGQKYAWLDRIATKCPTRHCASFQAETILRLPRLRGSTRTTRNVPVRIRPWKRVLPMTPTGCKATRYVTIIPVSTAGILWNPLLRVPFIFDCVWN